MSFSCEKFHNTNVCYRKHCRLGGPPAPPWIRPRVALKHMSVKSSSGTVRFGKGLCLGEFNKASSQPIIHKQLLAASAEVWRVPPLHRRTPSRVSAFVTIAILYEAGLNARQLT